MEWLLHRFGAICPIFLNLTFFVKTSSTVTHETYKISSLVSPRSLVVFIYCFMLNMFRLHLRVAGKRFTSDLFVTKDVGGGVTGGNCEYKTTREAEEIIADK